MVKSITVYCASSQKVDSKYFTATSSMAKEFAQKGIRIIYGGGKVGLMGCLADTALENGGAVKGIIPAFMYEVEMQHPGLTELVTTEDMSSRKMKLLEDTDAIVALPGGSGTFEELLEAITLKRLGKLTVPIVILNLDGYYDPLVTLLERAVEEKFMNPIHLKMWTVVNNVSDILPAIASSEDWSDDALSFAGVK